MLVVKKLVVERIWSKRVPGPLLLAKHFVPSLHLLRDHSEGEDSHPRQPRPEAEPPRQIGRDPVGGIRRTRSVASLTPRNRKTFLSSHSPPCLRHSALLHLAHTPATTRGRLAILRRRWQPLQLPGATPDHRLRANRRWRPGNTGSGHNGNTAFLVDSRGERRRGDGHDSGDRHSQKNCINPLPPHQLSARITRS